MGETDLIEHVRIWACEVGDQETSCFDTDPDIIGDLVGRRNLVSPYTPEVSTTLHNTLNSIIDVSEIFRERH